MSSSLSRNDLIDFRTALQLPEITNPYELKSFVRIVPDPNKHPLMTPLSSYSALVQDKFAGKAGEGERGRRSAAKWRRLEATYHPGRKFFPFRSN